MLIRVVRAVNDFILPAGFSEKGIIRVSRVRLATPLFFYG
jgi:hypothetical protein